MNNTKTHPRSTEHSIYVEDTHLGNMLDILFQQVRLQQEVRDRWFGHYLTIIGALTALATLCLKLFESAFDKEILYFVLSMIFIFSCSIGVLFYILYMCQRKNYKRAYHFMSIIEEMLKSLSVIPPELYKGRSFKSQTHGADFYTLFVQSLIDSTLFAVGIAFLSICFIKNIRFVGVISFISFIIFHALLQLIRFLYEVENNI